MLDPAAFIRANTRLQSPSHVPELRLHLADEVTPLWRLTEEALAELGLPPPYWAFAWAGGQGLARYVLEHPEEVAGRRVLDLASGSGVAGLAALKAGARSLVGADLDPFAGAALELNARANGLEAAFRGEDLLAGPPPDADVVLAGDVFYERALSEAALAWLGRAHARGTRVLLGDPGRTYFPRTGLVRLAEHRVPTSRELEDQEVKRTGVFTFPAGASDPVDAGRPAEG